MKPVVLFGTGKIAEVVLYFLNHDSDRTVAAVTVDRDYVPGEKWNGLPCVAFEEVSRRYPPQDFDMFVALGYQDLNSLRTAKVQAARHAGYQLISYVHPQSGMPRDCRIGDNCFVMNTVMIHPRVTLGDNVFVWSGAMIGHHSTIGDNCWLTSCSNVSGNVTVGRNCFLAVNATIGHGVTLGNNCFLGANCLVIKCAEDDSVFLEESTKPSRLNSSQFLRMSRFNSL